MTILYDSKTCQLVDLQSKENQDTNMQKEKETFPPRIINQDYTKLTHDKTSGSIILESKSYNISSFKAGRFPRIFNQGFYRTDNKNNIRISCEMKSIGTVLSNVYIAIDCFTEPSNNPEHHIPCIRGGMTLNDGFTLKEVITDASFALNIDDRGSENYNVFASHSSKECANGIAIFLDGNTNKLPDHLMSYTNGKVLYTLNDDVLTFNERFIPQDVINNMIIGKTIFRLHYANGYVYPLGMTVVPNTWNTYTMLLSPIGEYSKHDKVLRFGTKYIKVGLLSNYKQDSKNAELLVRNFVICDLE